MIKNRFKQLLLAGFVVLQASVSFAETPPSTCSFVPTAEPLYDNKVLIPADGDFGSFKAFNLGQTSSNGINKVKLRFDYLFNTSIPAMKITIPNLSDSLKAGDFKLDFALSEMYGDKLTVKVNGTVVFNGIKDPTNGFQTTVNQQNISSLLKDGDNAIEFSGFMTSMMDVTLEMPARSRQVSRCVNVAWTAPATPIIPTTPECEQPPMVCLGNSGNHSELGNIADRCIWYSASQVCKTPRKITKECDEAKSLLDTLVCRVKNEQCASTTSVTDPVTGVVSEYCNTLEQKLSCDVSIYNTTKLPGDRPDLNTQNAERALSCKPVVPCTDESCYINSSDKDEKDQDMPYVMALLEMGKQAGTYMNGKELRIFSGQMTRCRSKRGFGAMDGCCEVTQPVAPSSGGGTVSPTTDNVYKDSFKSKNEKMADPKASYQENYKNLGANPYTYDALYKPNEANYMVQSANDAWNTPAKQEAITQNSSQVKMMGWGFSETGATGDQKSFNQYQSTVAPDSTGN